MIVFIISALLISANLVVVVNFFINLYNQHTLVPLGSNKSLYSHISEMDPNISARYHLSEVLLTFLSVAIGLGIIYFMATCKVEKDIWYIVVISMFSAYLLYASQRHFISLQSAFIVSTMKNTTKKK